MNWVSRDPEQPFLSRLQSSPSRRDHLETKSAILSFPLVRIKSLQIIFIIFVFVIIIIIALLDFTNANINNSWKNRSINKRGAITLYNEFNCLPCMLLKQIGLKWVNIYSTAAQNTWHTVCHGTGATIRHVQTPLTLAGQIKIKTLSESWSMFCWLATKWETLRLPT